MILVAAFALAASAPVTVHDLVTVTDLSGLAVSPDQRWVAFRTEQPSLDRNVIAIRWWVAPVDGRTAARAVADGGIAVPNGAGVVLDEPPIWLPDASGFLFRARVAGAVQVWRVDLASKHVAAVTHADGDVLGFTLEPTGTTLTYITGPNRSAIKAAERRIQEVGGLVDAGVDLSIGLVGGGWTGDTPASVRMTGSWFDQRPFMADQTPRRWRVAIHGSDKPVPVAGSEDGKKSAPRRDAATAIDFCRAVDCASIRVTATVAIPGDAGALVSTTDIWERQTLWRWRNGRAHRVVAALGSLAGSRFDWTPCAPTSATAVCVAAAADAPPRLVRVDVKSGRTRTLFDPNAALAARVRGQARPITWSDHNGYRFTGHLIKPRSVRPGPAPGMPLVLQYYRCDGFLRGGVGDELPFYPLADAGIVGLCINKALVRRARQDSPADYELAEAGIVSIVDQLVRAGVVDRRRIGMQGLSFGSETTMWLARRSRLLAAASIASGQIEPSMYWYAGLPGRDASALMREAWNLAEPDGHDPTWRRVAPALDTAAIVTPLLLQLPEAEARWSIELHARLARAGKPIELHAFPNAAHVKFMPRQKEAAYRRNLHWFRFWLLSETDPDPLDPDQYSRWDRLRALARKDGIASAP